MGNYSLSLLRIKQFNNLHLGVLSRLKYKYKDKQWELLLISKYKNLLVTFLKYISRIFHFFILFQIFSTKCFNMKFKILIFYMLYICVVELWRSWFWQI